MKIGLITLSRMIANQSKYYNAQDLGLAKALLRKGNEVVIYRLTKDISKVEKEGNVEIVYQRVRGFGKQSLCNFEFLDGTLERLICFSDNQISFPSLCKWCEKRGILLQPYIGVLHSNSTRKTVRIITNTLLNRNVKRYQELKVYGKTPDIVHQLQVEKVRQTELVPVCLNEELLKWDYSKQSKIELRKKHHYCLEDRILLFIGRLEKEKEPIEIIEILDHIRQKDHRWKLLMVGKGELEVQVCKRIEELQLKSFVQRIPQISNQEMWELYYISDCFVNLNQHEIYGMSILEALYYRCPVVAMNAPGPAYILNQGEAGRLCVRGDELERCILELPEVATEIDTKEYLLERLSWDKVCNQFLGD